MGSGSRASAHQGLASRGEWCAAREPFVGAHDPSGAWPVSVPFPETTAWGQGRVQEEALSPAGGDHRGVRNDTCPVEAVTTRSLGRG